MCESALGLGPLNTMANVIHFKKFFSKMATFGRGTTSCLGPQTYLRLGRLVALQWEGKLDS